MSTYCEDTTMKALANNKAHSSSKNCLLKGLAAAVCACMASGAGHTSDLEIYQGATYGSATIMMMLDNSESMDKSSISVDYPNIAQGSSAFSKQLTQYFYDDDGRITSDFYNYTVDYVRQDDKDYYDRMSRLKMALIPMFANPKSNTAFGNNADLSKYKIGLGNFYIDNQDLSHQSHGGRIIAPALQLTANNRKRLILEMVAMSPIANSPMANAYAEAGAYMLGTTTKTNLSESTSPKTSSGFKQSANDTKVQPNNLIYNSPLSGIAGQCDGYGVYFLTDSEPNRAYDETLTLMESSLSGGSVSMGSDCNSGLLNLGTQQQTQSGWECIGEYSQALYNSNNAKGTFIATATVGFGSVFKQLINQPKISKTITRPNGVIESVEVYQCDFSGINQDAKNLCKLGEKGYNYGEGGFYYAEESVDIANSVRKFIEDMGMAEIEPISAATISVPADSLGGLRSRQFAYLPILQPNPGSARLWNGNLKKYKVKNATLVGSNDNLVFADTAGRFAKDSYDEWNTIIDDSRSDTLRPDTGAAQVGGSYQKIFENSNAAIMGDRNLFVDNGDSLNNLKVSQNRQPLNFSSLIGYDNKQKLALLNFMGYSEPDATVVTDGAALIATQDKGLKNIGAVLHSIPQLITQKVEIKASGEFDNNKREDYLIYGSMDGALHMLDDSTGQEVFTFIPKQILDLQPDALAGKGSAKDGSHPYGVDAPWLTYASYSTKTITSNKGAVPTTMTSYQADQSFALGGLRMGGSMYYALDVSKVSEPKIIYGIGSNYANKLQDKLGATVLAGTINNVTSNATAEQQAFAKMGQTWAKPTLGYVKSAGKRVMVSFLPGGYDTCYENPQFKLQSSYPADAQCHNKSAAQGSSVYMVQMGQVKTEANEQERVDTALGNGKLLWWASNTGASSANTTAVSSLQYSTVKDLKHSVVTQIRAMDRNYDGLIDHIYFADLGGQVWRVDINNNKDTANFKIDRVVKVLDVSAQASASDAPPRFYERPLVTFYNSKYAYVDADKVAGSYNGVTAMVTVGSGDRSNPVTAVRAVPDALYNIIDKDVTRTNLFDYQSAAASNISLRTPTSQVAGNSDRNDKLQALTFSSLDLGPAGIKQSMSNGLIQGWYMPFNTWLGADAKVAGKYKIKMLNEPDAIAGVLISSSFNPDVGQQIQACSAGVIGETQRQRTCLPYGSCLNSSGAEMLTARSTFNAGSGIVDNIISQFNDSSLFTSLVNRCVAENCKPTLICPGGNCGNEDNVFNECVGPSCGVNSAINTDKRLNPLSWMEH